MNTRFNNILSNATPRVDTDTGTVSTGAQHKRDEVDALEKVADRKVNEVTENDYVREHQAGGADTETETTGAHRRRYRDRNNRSAQANKMNADAKTCRNEGIALQQWIHSPIRQTALPRAH